MTQTTRIAQLSFAHVHAPTYAQSLKSHPNAELSAIWDTDSRRGAAMAEQYGSYYYSNLDELLKSGVEGVVITSENSRHAEIIERIAASKGAVKAILCEKPLAISKGEGERMIASAASAGIALYTAFPCRYSPAFTKAQAVVKSGKLGKVIGIRATNHGVCPFGWFVDPELSGGGAVIDHTVHVADLTRALLEEEIVSVYAEAGNNMYHQNWEDTAFLTLTYSDGVFATLDASWTRPKNSFKTWGDVTLEILGENGQIEIDMFGQGFLNYDEPTGQTRLISWGSNIDDALIDDFVHVVNGGSSTLLATGEDGLAAANVAFAAYASIASKLPEPVALS